VLPRDSRFRHQARRAGRRNILSTPECLEERTVLSFSSLGFSLPQLIISGEAGPRAAWGGNMDVSAYLQNIGTSTITEPFAQAPGATSTADAGDSIVTVIATPKRNSLRNAISLGTIEAPPVTQNSLEQLAASFTLPARPPHFQGPGGKFFVRFEVNSSYLSAPVPVQITRAALPELRAIALYTPPTMQPGDTIAPVIQVENLGTASTASQGPLTVALVASVTPTFTLGSSIVAEYTVSNIDGVSRVPTRANYKTLGKLNLMPPANVVTINGAPVTLPTSPSTYYLGVVVDPNGVFHQLSTPANPFSVYHVVGPPLANLPPAGVVSAPLTGVFPTPPAGQLIGNG